MRSTIFTILSLAATGVLASPSHPWAPGHGFFRRSTCAAVTVEFHFNDTSIGTTESCSTDVMNRGGASTTSRRQTADDASCIDGPSTNYTVVAGDTLERIAAEFNSGVCNIAAANSLDDPDFILVGQVLSVPTSVCTADNESCRNEAGTAACVAADSGVASTYTIVAGDTFFAISSELGITLEALVAANPDTDAGNLQIGQVINIPVCDA